MMFWQPHWIFAQEDLKWVEWNKIDGECIEETQARETACGFAQAKDEQNAMILEVDQNGRLMEEVVQEWMTANEAKWTTWVQ